MTRRAGLVGLALRPLPHQFNKPCATDFIEALRQCLTGASWDAALGDRLATSAKYYKTDPSIDVHSWPEVWYFVIKQPPLVYLPFYV